MTQIITHGKDKFIVTYKCENPNCGWEGDNPDIDKQWYMKCPKCGRFILETLIEHKKPCCS